MASLTLKAVSDILYIVLGMTLNCLNLFPFFIIMFEIIESVCDEYGSRCVGVSATFLEANAYDKVAELRKMYPERDFSVEYVPAADEWNAY